MLCVARKEMTAEAAGSMILFLAAAARLPCIVGNVLRTYQLYQQYESHTRVGIIDAARQCSDCVGCCLYVGAARVPPPTKSDRRC